MVGLFHTYLQNRFSQDQILLHCMTLHTFHTKVDLQQMTPYSFALEQYGI